MRTSTFTLDGSTIVTAGNTTVVTLSTINNTQSKFGSDIGGGVFVFANDFTQALLSGLTFWRANLGIAYRW